MTQAQFIIAVGGILLGVLALSEIWFRRQKKKTEEAFAVVKRSLEVSYEAAYSKIMVERIERILRQVLQGQETILQNQGRDNALIQHLHRDIIGMFQKLERIMATLDEVLADVAEEGTKLDSLSTFIAGLKQQIADALAGTTLPPAVQAKVDAVFAGVESNKGKVQAALDANVPPTP
jgi:hypothetical protein